MADDEEQLWSVEGYERGWRSSTPTSSCRDPTRRDLRPVRQVERLSRCRGERFPNGQWSGIGGARPRRDRRAAMLDALAALASPRPYFPTWRSLPTTFACATTSITRGSARSIPPRPTAFSSSTLAARSTAPPSSTPASRPASPLCSRTAPAGAAARRAPLACGARGRRELEALRALPLGRSHHRRRARNATRAAAFCASRILRLYRVAVPPGQPPRSTCSDAAAARCGAGAAPSAAAGAPTGTLRAKDLALLPRRHRNEGIRE